MFKGSKRNREEFSAGDVGIPDCHFSKEQCKVFSEMVKAQNNQIKFEENNSAFPPGCTMNKNSKTIVFNMQGKKDSNVGVCNKSSVNDVNVAEYLKKKKEQATESTKIPTCIRSTTNTGYDYSGVKENLKMNSFSVTDLKCTSSYEGNPTATACTADGQPYSVSGCKPNWNWRVKHASKMVNDLEKQCKYGRFDTNTHKQTICNSVNDWKDALNEAKEKVEEAAKATTGQKAEAAKATKTAKTTEATKTAKTAEATKTEKEKAAADKAKADKAKAAKANDPAPKQGGVDKKQDAAKKSEAQKSENKCSSLNKDNCTKSKDCMFRGDKCLICKNTTDKYKIGTTEVTGCPNWEGEHLTYNCDFDIVKNNCPKSCDTCDYDFEKTKSDSECKNVDDSVTYKIGETQVSGCPDWQGENLTYNCNFDIVKKNCPISCKTCDYKCKNVDDSVKYKIGETEVSGCPDWQGENLTYNCDFDIVKKNCPISCNTCDYALGKK